MTAPEKNKHVRKYVCAYCGTINEVKVALSDLLFEGNYPNIQAADQRPGDPSTFTCTWCGRKNSIVAKK